MAPAFGATRRFAITLLTFYLAVNTMYLDIATLLVAALIVSVASTGARLLLCLQHRNIPGPTHWFASMLLSTIVLVLIVAQQNQFSYLFISMLPTALVISFIITWDGFRRFNGRKPLSKLTIAAFIFASIMWAMPINNLYYIYLRPCTIVEISVICGIISWELFAAETRRQTATLIVAGLFFANAAFSMLRAVNILIDPAAVINPNLSSISIGLALWWLWMPLATTLAMILMTGDRLKFEINQKMQRLDEVMSQKLAEERLRLIEKGRIESMLRQWMADSSHELRTPMTVLRAQIEAMQDGIFAPDTRRLDILHNEVMGMARLVEDLFVLARSDIGQLECRTDTIDLLDVLDSVVDAFRPRYAETDLTIACFNHTTGSTLIGGDEPRLRQVLANLLENSLRYTDRGGRLAITCATVGRNLTLHFDDTGPGVPDEALPLLFDRFFRVDHSRSRASGGSGLGLALCRTLIEAQGGTITAQHSPLGGLRVAIRVEHLQHA